MASFRSIGEQAARAEEASAKSAAEAKTAAEQAAAVRADLQSKQSQLQLQIAVVKSQYLALTPRQREALAALPPRRRRRRPHRLRHCRDRVIPRHSGRSSGRHPAGRHRTAGSRHRPPRRPVARAPSPFRPR